MEYEPFSGSDLDFTHRAKKTFVTAVKDPYFLDSDYDLVYDLLKNRMQIVPFCDYLKRYIYTKAEMTGNYQAVPLSDYLEIICSEFADRQTPCSFTPTSTKLRNAARNWLEQQTVNRNVVLLLGFGLGMSADDVDTFLTKVLQESKLNAKDPFESLCWYCYSHGLGYIRFSDLWERYQALPAGETDEDLLLDTTVRFRKKLADVSGEAELMHFLSSLPVVKNAKRQSVSARQHFDRLYAGTKALVARILTETEIDSARMSAGRMEEKLSREDRLYDFEKLQRIKNEKGNFTTFTAEDITPGDIENVILSAVPKDKNGNLVSLKSSSLEKQFYGKRLTRQRLTDIIAGTIPITRYDLLTLHFFVFSQTCPEKRKTRYVSFIDSANLILRDCSMGPIYVANPYECFLLMCLLTDDPFGTYADVWELSYSNA